MLEEWDLYVRVKILSKCDKVSGEQSRAHGPSCFLTMIPELVGQWKWVWNCVCHYLWPLQDSLATEGGCFLEGN